MLKQYLLLTLFLLLASGLGSSADLQQQVINYPQADIVHAGLPQEAKVLLMSSVILSFVLLVLSGSLLFYVYKTGVLYEQ